MEIQNFKMRVTPEQSRIVQQTLFNNEYKKYYGSEIYIPEKLQTFIYLNSGGFFTANNSDMIYFNYNTLPELTFQEFFDTYVKWCVKDCEEVSAWSAKEFKTTNFVIESSYMCVIPNYSNCEFYSKEVMNKENFIEITFEQFKQYVLKTKNMEKKIIGYKLLKDLPDRRAGIIFKWDSLEEGGWTSGDEEDDYTYTQEQVDTLTDWFKPVYEESSKELYFGRVKFTIKKGDNFATTEYGKVTKEEISKVFEYFNNPPALVCGKYPLKFDLHNDSELKFGCQSGTLGELRAIYNAFE